jgi:hypothetical protein
MTRKNYWTIVAVYLIMAAACEAVFVIVAGRFVLSVTIAMVLGWGFMILCVTLARVSTISQTRAREEKMREACELTREVDRAQDLPLFESLDVLRSVGIWASSSDGSKEKGSLELPEVFWLLSPDLIAKTLVTVTSAREYLAPDLAKKLLLFSQRDPEYALAVALVLGEMRPKLARSVFFNLNARSCR